MAEPTLPPIINDAGSAETTEAGRGTPCPAVAPRGRNDASSPPRLTLYRVALAAILLPVVAVGTVLFCFDPSRHSFYPVCHFHEMTGLLCAGCGSSRALYHLLHGHLVLAFRFNPLLVVSLPFVGWLAARYVRRALRNEPTSLPIKPEWLWLMLAVLVVFTVVRNLPGLPLALQLPGPPLPPSQGLRTAR